LRDKILPLADDLIVYPNHAGSACGKNMSKKQIRLAIKRKQIMLQEMSEEEFVKAIQPD
jgi:hypothetical protein